MVRRSERGPRGVHPVDRLTEKCLRGDGVNKELSGELK